MGKIYDRVFRWSNGTTPLPERYYFDNNCSRDHAINGKIIRRHRKDGKTGKCLLCQQIWTRRSDANRDNPSIKALIHRQALESYEDSQLDLDPDPLFD
jgi:hypothetical protein